MSYERLNIQDFVDKWDVAKVQHLEDGIVANEEAIERYHNDSVVEVQADWEQNDPTAKDYVKNRTHYKETETYSIANNFETTYHETHYENGEVVQYLEPYDFSCDLLMEGKEPTSLRVFVNGESIKVVDYRGYVNWAYWNLENNLRIEYSSRGPKGESSELQFSWSVSPINGFEAVDGQKFNLTVTIDGVTYVPIDEKYMPKSVLEWQQPVDWNCNDVNDPTYIKNRTHYDYWEQENKIYDYSDYKDEGTLPHTFQVTKEGNGWLGGHGFMYNDCLFNSDSNWEEIGKEYDETLDIWKVKYKCQQTQIYHGEEETLIINAASYSQYVSEKGEWVNFVTIDCEYEGYRGIQLYEVEKRSKTLDKRFLADFSVEKDWNMNDPTDPKYIENRTHYSYLGQDKGLLFDEYDSEMYNEYNFLPYTQVTQSDLIETDCPGYWLGKEAGYWINLGNPSSPQSYLVDAYSDWEKIGEEENNIIIYQCEIAIDWYSCVLTVAVQPIADSFNEYNIELRNATCSGETHFGVSTAKKMYKTLDVEYLPDGLPNDIDWNENNKTSRSYIKNRPCYEKEVTYATIFDYKITESPYRIDSGLLNPISTFRIICGDTEEITETEAYSWTQESGNYGYYLITTPSVEIKTTWYLGDSSSTTITIREGFEVPYNVTIQTVDPAMIKQLDEKFIPDTIARKSDLESINSPVTSVNGQTGNVELNWASFGEKVISEEQIVYESQEFHPDYYDKAGKFGTTLNIGDTCKITLGGDLVYTYDDEYIVSVSDLYTFKFGDITVTYNSSDNTYTFERESTSLPVPAGTISITKLGQIEFTTLKEEYIPNTIARAPKATFDDIEETPTASDFNTLLSILREAGILATE